MIGPNTLAAALALAVVGGAFVSGYQMGGKQARATCDQARIHAVQRAIEQAAAQAQEDADILRAAAIRQQAAEARAKTLTKTVTRYVETPAVRNQLRDCRLDACGLCLARSAAAGADGSACPCLADDPLPASGGADHGDAGGAAGELHGNRHAPAGLHGQARGIDRVGGA